MPERTRKKLLDAVLVFSFDRRTAQDVKRGVVSIEDAQHFGPSGRYPAILIDNVNVTVKGR